MNAIYSISYEYTIEQTSQYMNCILFQTSYVHGYHKETHYQIILQLWPALIIVYFCKDQCTTQVWLQYKILAMDNDPEHILGCATAVWISAILPTECTYINKYVTVERQAWQKIHIICCHWYMHDQVST